MIAHLQSQFSDLQMHPLADQISEQLISPFQVELPKSVLTQAQDFVQATFDLRQSEQYLQHYQTQLSDKNIIDPGNHAIMMSYDFHLDETQTLKLIEINTNAAFLAMGYEMYRMRGLPLPVADFTMAEIRDCILNEMQQWGSDKRQGLRVSIIDDNPQAQRLFVEFLLYQSYFKIWGFDVSIDDYRELSENVDFVYNRFTDFYFTQESSLHLKKMYCEKQICFSPNPFEYFMLADKQRLIDWVDPQFWSAFTDFDKQKNIIQKHLLSTAELTKENAEELWSQRKNLFFKPKQAFGSKQSYKGSSISRRLFDELTSQSIVAQQYLQAPEMTFNLNQQEFKLKYDLRFYVYQNRVQLVLARLYNGQVTNLQTPMGGFAPVVFV